MTRETDPAGHLASRTVRIGITGPIGCGKSKVAGFLGKLGAVVIDADRVAHQVTDPGTPALAQIASVFGTEVLREDGTLDRHALGRIVFSDPAALVALEAIVHPAVRPAILDEMAAAERTGAPAVVVEAIKLVEGGLAELCDEVWLITCAPDQQLARLRARLAAASGGSGDPGSLAADTEARVAAQAGLVARLTPTATRVLDTSGTLEEVRAITEAAYHAALARAHDASAGRSQGDLGPGSPEG
jgi:dephospho-CoA kinase